MTRPHETRSATDRTDRHAELRRLFRERLEARRKRRLVPPDPPPRYDEIFWRGMEWLDSL